jgi:acyl homoserine lactone synthase/acyl-homoserine lactone synthase
MPSQFPPVPSSLANPALRTMFEARKRVFVDLLKWDIPVLEERYEVDQFDTPEAEYLVLVDERGGHRASARLLRTDRPHILADLFPELCEGAIPAGSSIREITRFCLEPTLSKPERRNARDELVTALAEHAMQNGITDYTGVAGEAWFGQIAAFGWSCRALGAPRRCGSTSLVGLHIRIDAETTASLAAAGIYRPPGRRLAAGALQ